MIVNWDLILNDLSVRLKNGTPDFKNEQHIIKLWDVLKEHNWPIEARVQLLQTLQERDIVKNKKTIGIGLLVIIQSFVLIIKNAVHSNINFLPLMYIFPILILITCVYLLSNNYKYYRSLLFIKRDNK